MGEERNKEVVGQFLSAFETWSDDVMCEREWAEGDTWHHDLVMMKAKGLAVFVEENWPVRRSQGISYVGSEVGIPMLLAFAAELGLKAWKLRERGKRPEPTHDLIKLFMDLDEAGRRRLELASKSRVVSVLELECTYPGIENVLEKCKKIFVDWRYSHERRQTVVESGSLLIAVKDIIAEYERDGETVYQRMSSAAEVYRRMLEYKE